MSLPISDDRLFVLAREDIIHGGRGRPGDGFTTGFLVRDRWIQAQRRGGFYPLRAEAGPTASWTAGLKRLVRDGRLRTCVLQGRRGGPAPRGFRLPSGPPERIAAEG